ncbi:MAG: hypothetical protein M5T61_14645 [Acidimicrobiia bacterium]|nr:hypothetical protein [Acidimicrobiia bacterium]
MAVVLAGLISVMSRFERGVGSPTARPWSSIAATVLATASLIGLALRGFGRLTAIPAVAALLLASFLVRRPHPAFWRHFLATTARK